MPPPRSFDQPAPAAPFAVMAWHYALVALPLVLALVLVNAAVGADRAVYAFFSAQRDAHPLVKAGLRGVTDWGNALFYVVYAALLARGLATGDKPLVRFVLLYGAAQLVVALCLVHGIKIAIGRPRPDVEGFFQPFSTASAFNSLPSGHTTEIMGAALPLALWRRRVWLSLALGGVVALVGFSRLYLGMHHISDVAFGLALGSLAGCAVIAFWNRNP
ncbi:MAG: phosphatase PAP2 family protein [Desulfovibrionaceae bacterium]